MALMAMLVLAILVVVLLLYFWAWLYSGVRSADAFVCSLREEVPTRPSTWRLVRQHAGLRVLTRLHGPEFQTRLEAAVPFPTAEMLAIPREFDLAPTWNKFVERGEVRQLISPTELVGLVALRLPWPLPRALIHFHVALTDLMDSEGVFSAVVRSVDGVALPGWTAGVRALHVQRGELRLRPLPSSGHGAARVQRTGLELELRLDLNKVLPGAAIVGKGILWAVEFALAVMIPFIWDLSLRTLDSMVTQDGPMGRRLREDATGVYAMVRRRAGQEAAVSKSA